MFGPEKNEIMQKKRKIMCLGKMTNLQGFKTMKNLKQMTSFWSNPERKRENIEKGIKKGYRGKAQEILGPNKKIRSTGKIPKSVDDNNPNKNGSK
jgi:hypothetical protein